MRVTLANSIIEFSKTNEIIFLTGDLGFMALEELRDSLGEKFINCGVSEQNMIGVAAGLAKEGFKVFVYSIAPFLYARPFEQIRNNIVFNRLPVCLIGNGGGFAYGSMGPTHHALEDCSVMSSLGLEIKTPIFDNDIVPIIENIKSPTYLRLGQQVLPNDKKIPKFRPWRRLTRGNKTIIISFGPLAGLLWKVINDLPQKLRPTLWAVSDFNFSNIPNEFIEEINEKNVVVFEEHVKNGGFGMHLSHFILKNCIKVTKFKHFAVDGYPKETFGSQRYHRNLNKIDETHIKSFIYEQQIQ